MGFSIDDTHQFMTGDPEYNRFIEWQYKVLNDKGYITKREIQEFVSLILLCSVTFNISKYLSSKGAILILEKRLFDE